MNSEVVGKFIKKLREEKNLTQKELADKIPVTREAVSKWERGLNNPDKDSLRILANVFDISVEELIIGRRSKDDLNKNNELTLSLYEHNLKKEKKIKRLYLMSFIILAIFSVYYFVTTFNTIKVYTLSFESENIKVTDGIFVTTKDKIYFNISNIESNFEIEKLKLYYKQNDKNELIYEIDAKAIILYDFYGYNEYFKYSNLKQVINNLFLDITSNDKVYTIQLDVKTDFANNKIFNNKKANIFKDDTRTEFNFSNIDTNLIKEKFDYDNGVYIYQKSKNVTLTYFEEAFLINLSLDEDTKKEWNYYIVNDSLEYNEYQDNTLIKSFSYENNEIQCYTNNCINNNSEITYFYDTLKNVLYN